MTGTVMKKYSNILLFFTANLFLWGCEASSKDSALRTGVSGYENLNFGMSFDESVKIAGPSRFNPASLKGCLVERAIKGCTLFPIDNLTTFVTIEGIPYGLGLSFDKMDNLSEVSLMFERSTTEDEEQRMRKTDCRAIHERTVDWVSNKYGTLERPSYEGGTVKGTASGNRYWGEKDDNASSQILHGETIFSDETSIKIFSSFIDFDSGVSCDVKVQFSAKRNTTSAKADGKRT